MYEHLFHFFGLRENPFHVSPDPRFYFSTRAHDSALAELQFGVDSRQGFIVLTGESGTGKTTVLNHFLNWLQERRQSSSYIFHSLLKPSELFEFVLRDFGVPFDGRDKSDVLETLNHWLIQRHSMGDSPVLIIDEAQAISVRTLDQVRLLLNLETPGSKLLQIVLAGQPELEDKLRRPELRQLRQRVMFRCNLVPLSSDEAVQYVESRLAAAGAIDVEIFSQESVEAAHMYARGIPRTLNLLCEHALISAYADQVKVVTPEIVRRVATDFDLTSQPAAEQERDTASRFGRLVAFRPEERSARVTAQMEYLQTLGLDSNGDDAAALPRTGESANAPPPPQHMQQPAAAIIQEPISSAPLANTMPNIAPPEIPSATLPAVAASALPGSRFMGMTSAAATAPAKIPVSPKPTMPASSEPLPQQSRQSPARASTAYKPAVQPSIANHVVTLVAKPLERTAPAAKKPIVRTQGPSFGVRFLRYWKSVSDSFLHDWKQLMGAHGLAKSVAASSGVANWQRNVLVPITKWLKQPAMSPHPRKNSSAPPAAAKGRRQ